MLLKKRLEDVTWDDVQAFCALQLGESAVLDYKQDFPTHLESTIAAMANTTGGAIIIGVVENDQGRPQAPFEGIAFARGLAERVQNILTAHVQPLLDVGVAVPTNSDGSRAFVVARIPQSPLAPHTVDGAAIYVRTGNRNHPEKQATADQIEWLLNNRSRATALRQRLLGQALKRSKTMGEPRGAILMLSLCPTYPGEAFRDPRRMVELYPQIRIRDYYGSAEMYPIGDPRTVQDAAVGVATIEDVGAFWYAELNVHGLYLTRQTLLSPQQQEDDADARPDLIRASEIVARTDLLIRSGERFYDAIDYRGPLEFAMRLENANHYALESRLDPRGWGNNRLPECPDTEIVLDLRVSGMALAQERRGVVLGSIARVGHAYNVNFSADQVDGFVARESGLALAA